MGTITNSTNLFPEKLVPEIFQKVAGHSTLAKLSASKPIPFSGIDEFVFTMDGEASIVGEGANKAAGVAAVTPVAIRPIKFVYQHRLTDEFVNLAEEAQVPYLQAFTDGFAKKIARGLDIAAFHGKNPADGAAVTGLATKNLDALAGQIAYVAASADDNIDAAVQAINGAEGQVTGIAMAPAFSAALAAIKVNGVVQYPEYRFGQNPDAFYGMQSDVNSTVSFGASSTSGAKNPQCYVGDFANAIRWGYAGTIPMEVIQYGDPDGQGDLKRTNQIVLRAEAYIGWGILDASSFKAIVSTVS